MDLEPLYHILRHDTWFHGPVHTVLVASAVGLVVGFLTSAIGRRFLGRRATTGGLAAGAGKTSIGAEAALGPALLGGFLGGASHPLLDATMHHDIHPFRPFTEGNPLLGVVSLPALLASCLVAGALGLILIFLRRARSARSGL